MSLSNFTGEIVAKRDKKRGKFNEMCVSLMTIDSTLKYVIGLEKNPIWHTLLKETNEEELWKEILSESNDLLKEVSLAISPDGIFTLAHRGQKDYM